MALARDLATGPRSRSADDGSANNIRRATARLWRPDRRRLRSGRRTASDWYSGLSLLWRPAISLGAGAAHQRGPFSVAQAGSLQEGLDGLLVVDNSERARPVGAPQAAVETPGVEHASERVPDVRERVRLPGQRAGAGDLDHCVFALGAFQHLGEVGPGLRRRGWHARLQDSEMIDDEAHVGVAVDQRGARVDIAPEQDVDREIVSDGCAQDAVEAGVVRRAL